MFDWVHFQYPSRVFFEMESTHKIGSLVQELGSRIIVLAVRDEISNADQLAVIKTSLEKHTSGCIIYDDIASNPGTEELDTAAHFVKQSNADLIMAFGARNSLNAARTVSLLCTNEVFAADLAEAELPLKKAPLPLVTVPTLPCMGEESSPTVFIHNPETREDFFTTDRRLFPVLVFVDPGITTSLSPTEIAGAGVATMSACIETILGKRSNEITNSIALRALELITHNLITVVNDAQNKAARMNVCLSSILCGMAHSNTQLGLAYALATSVHNLTGLNFYTAISILLPHIMEYNLTTSANKYVQIARALDEDISDITVIEAAIKAVEGVRKIFMGLKVPQRLSEFEIAKSDLPSIAEQAINIPLVRNTPRELDKNEIEMILIAAY